MVDQAAPGQTNETDQPRTRRFFRLPWRDVEVGRLGVGVVVLALSAIAGAYFIRHEGNWANIAFVTSATLTVAFSVLLLTRRVLVSAIVVAAMIALVVLASIEKSKLMHMAVHAYDIFYYLSSLPTLDFLWSNYTALMIQLVAASLAVSLAVYVSHRIDGTRIHRRHAALGVLLCAALTYWAAEIKGARGALQQWEEDLALSTFYSSWSDTVETLWKGQLVEAADAPNGRTFAVPTDCRLSAKPPNILLIHQESLVPPEYFPRLDYDKTVDRMFRSDDGKLHKLRVETYAGASWLTEFSVLAGVSTFAFGSMRPFVQSLMAGRVHDTVPEALTRCDYRNVVFYPLNKNFVSNGRFYEAVGMPEIFDMTSQKSRSGFERDRFFYSNALDVMEEHFKTSKKPLFTFLLTFATHQPYFNTYMPEVDVPGGGPGTEPEMHEFLRRLSMARLDYDFLKQELARRFPNERFLILHYGDHQPTSTWPYITEDDRNAIRSKDRDKIAKSDAYLTYFAVEGINYKVPPLPDLDVVDVPYLGPLLLKSAGLPLSEAQAERLRLMQLCGGRYDSCQQSNEILAFHRRLIDSGLLDSR